MILGLAASGACGPAVAPASVGPEAAEEAPEDDFDGVVHARPAADKPVASRAPVSEAPRIERRWERPRRARLAPRGRPIDLNLRNADLHNVFRFLADVGGVNIVVAPTVKGAITLRLRRVPWDAALRVICKAHGLTAERDGSIILIHRPK